MVQTLTTHPDPQIIDDAAATTRDQMRFGPLQIVLFPARMFLALGWIRAGVEKIIDGDWWTGSYLLDFLSDHEGAMIPPLQTVTDWIGVRSAAALSLYVLIAELLIGLFLLTGRRLRPALIAACLLNLSFVALGAVNPSAFYLILQLTLLLGLQVGRHRPKFLTMAAAGGAFIVAGIAALPFAMTLHPAEVIDDPALMITTLAFLCAASTGLLGLNRIDSSG